MELSTNEQQQIKKLLEDEHRPGMILWMEESADGGVNCEGYVQGNPIDLVMMTIHAVNFSAEALNTTPEQVLKKISSFLVTKRKLSDIRKQ